MWLGGRIGVRVRVDLGLEVGVRAPAQHREHVGVVQLREGGDLRCEADLVMGRG